jgi:hypothetical protein
MAKAKAPTEPTTDAPEEITEAPTEDEQGRPLFTPEGGNIIYLS